MRKLVLLFTAAFLVLSLHAENFTVEEYSVSINVSDDRSMEINEDIALDYTVPSHGFIRDIQYRFGSVRAGVDDILTHPDADVSRDGSYVSVRFGDPDRLVSGRQDYSLSYRYSPGADSYADYDELYYNIVSPSSWDAAMERVSFSITFPYPVDSDRIWLTYGPYHSSAELPFELSPDGCTVSGSYYGLPAGYGMTIRAEMEEGYFSSAAKPFDLAAAGAFASMAVSILTVIAAFLIWYLKGRDEKLIAPLRYTPPDGLTPMEAGFIYNGALEDSAVSAMLISWADRGYVTITDNGGDDFTFSAVRELPDDVSEAEAALFAAFFSSSSAVDTKMLRMNGFSQKLARVRKAEAESFSGERSLSSPASSALRKKVMRLLLIPVVLFAVLSTLFFPGFPTVFILFPSVMAYGMLRGVSGTAEKKMRSQGFRFSYILPPLFFLAFIWFFIVSALSSFGQDYKLAALSSAVFLAALFASAMLSASIDRRSDYASLVLGQIVGYRDFIERVEKERIEKLSASDPEFFYHVLSYAMALGVEEKWVRAFSGMYVPPVSWYSGSDISDIYILSSFSRRWHHAYSNTIAPRQGGGARTSRGSSGFSGGGFSGGGGRSW